MEFRVLGPLEIRRDGEAVALESFRQRSLLALLLIHANEVVSTDRIIDELWGDEAGPDRQNALWVHVSGLRSALEPEREKRSAGTVLITRAPGYVLHLQPDELDAWRFDQLLQEGRALLAHDPAAASLVLGEALALWRGRSYEDVAYEPFAQAAIAELEERRLEAVELRVDADLRRGLAGELVPELEGLARQHPLREQLTAVLMVALYRSGRRADALRAYSRLKHRLVEELGVDPSPALQALEAQVLAGDPALDDAAGLAGAPARLAIRGYELREAIGEGRSGLTYRAYQPVVGREVAIKVTRPEVANDPELIRRFESEAELVARLEHPHIAPLYDFWREPDAAYLVTRLFRRGNLEEAVRTGPLDQAAAAQMVADVGSALALAHRHGVVHGAVAPANILLDDDQRAYLSDFGTILGLHVDGAELRAAGNSSAFVAPEQRAGAPATVRSDVYGLALVLAFGLTGRPPGELPLALAELPSPVRDVVKWGTAADTGARPAEVAAFATAARDALGWPAAPDIPPATENPYKGLLAFEEADAPDFFGRSRQVERLLVRLGDGGLRGRFVAVVGPSGSGKSSVVHAGLVPALRRDALPGSAQWFMVSMAPGRQPFDALAAALVGIAVTPPVGLLEELSSGPAGLARAVRRVMPDPQALLLLVIDQFEELFTQAADGVGSAFLDALAAAVADPHSRLRVVVTLRADFYDRPLQHRAVGELLRVGTEVITPMGPEELEEAIDGPASGAGVRFEPGLVAEIVADVAGRSAALPLLQYALTELYERRRGQVIELAAYREIGGVSGALARRAETLFNALDLPARDTVRQVFFRLVTIGEGTEVVRRRVLRQELAALDGAAVDTVLETFGQHRLLSFDRDAQTRGPTVEIAHEALLSEWERLRRWLEDGRDDLRQHRRLAAAAREWEQAGRDPAYLLRGSRLDQLDAWSSATDLTLLPEEHAYLGASIAWRDAERTSEEERRRREEHLHRAARRRTRLLAGGAVALTAVVALAAFAVVQRNEADRLARELAATGEASRLASAGGDLAEDDPELATLLALQAMDVSADAGIPALPEAESALHWALQGRRITFPVADALEEVRVGPRGPTGIFRLPIAELIGVARDHLDRTFTEEECQTYGIDPCPVDGDGLASPADSGRREVPGEPAAARADRALPLAGTTVTAIGGFPLTGGVQAELDRFEQETGVRVSFTNAIDSEFEIQRLLSAGEAPDVVFLPQPGTVKNLGASGDVVDLGTYLDAGAARSAFGDYVIDHLSDGSALYGLPAFLNVKGLVWYPEPEFREAGYSVPTTWNELVALTERMVADGRQPWCIGFESGSASGWPGTDWIEALVLRLGGVETYDRWVSHEIAFTDPIVRRATAMFGEILFGEDFVAGGAPSVNLRNVFDAAGPLLTDEPGCWLHSQASFLVSEAFPAGVQPGVDAGFFALPPIEAGDDTPGFGGGTLATALSDRPEVRAFMRRLVDPEWGAAWAAHPSGYFLPANAAFDPEQCRGTGLDPRASDVRVRFCRASQEAVAADRWRFDASDLMPPEVGTGTFWQGMLDYAERGPASLDQVLAEMEAGWP